MGLVPGMHAGYIPWEEYETNQRRLQENAQAHGADRRRSPPRQGPALLQGIVLCGICGGRMGVRYHDRDKRLVPDYVCQPSATSRAAQACRNAVRGAAPGCPGPGIYLFLTRAGIAPDDRRTVWRQ